jgi:hypothetical protein
VGLEYDRTVCWNPLDRPAWSRTVCACASDRPRCAARAPAPAPWSALAPQRWGRDGHFKSLPSIGSLLGHYFPTRNFMIPIGLSCVADDYLFVFAFISCVWPNQDPLALKIDHVHRKGLRVHLHFLKFQSSFVNDRLNLSTEYITIISGMRK